MRAITDMKVMRGHEVEETNTREATGLHEERTWTRTLDGCHDRRVEIGGSLNLYHGETECGSLINDVEGLDMVTAWTASQSLAGWSSPVCKHALAHTW